MRFPKRSDKKRWLEVGNFDLQKERKCTIHIAKTKVLISCSFCCFFLFVFFFNSVLRPFQDYFSPYETGQSVGGAKTREPREKTPGTQTSRTWLVSHLARAGLEHTLDTAVR